MAVKKKKSQRWKTGPLHLPGSGHDHGEKEAAQRLAPLEETDAFKDSQQKDASAHTPDDTIRVDSASVRMPESFADDEREGASIFRLEPVALVLLVAMVAFIAFVAWQISLMPDK